MHMNISHEGRVQRSITCTSRNIHLYITHPMYRSACHGVTLLRHRYGCHGVTPQPHVIAIYRTCMYYSPVIATWRSRYHDSFQFIVRILLCQTIDDSSYVTKWLPSSNPPPLSSLFIVRCCQIPPTN